MQWSKCLSAPLLESLENQTACAFPNHMKNERAATGLEPYSAENRTPWKPVEVTSKRQPSNSAMRGGNP